MQYSTLIRKKDKGYQYIITYKENDSDIKWKTKSKQGYALNKAGKELARAEMDLAISALKKEVENQVDSSLKNITFKRFTDMYIEHAKLYRTTNTIVSFNTVLKHFSDLNDIEVNKITLMDIQPIIDKLTIAKLNPNTIQNYVVRLNVIFNAAINEYNLIDKLPTKNVKINKNKKATNKKALNKKEVVQLLEDFKDSKYYLVLLIAATCGLRLGEILGLTWADIDSKKSILSVNKQWKQISLNVYDFGSLKSKNSNREVPIPPKTNNILKAITVKNMSGRIFNFKKTNTISIVVNAALKKGGYNITIHELRHTYATLLIGSGVDFKTAAKLLGHSVEQTMKTYAHVNDDMFKRATNIIENIF